MPPARAWRKRAGLANLHYLRHGRRFVLIATHGRHSLFEEEAANIRRVPFKLGGYSVRYPNGRALVRIDQESEKRLKVYLTDLTTRRSVDHLVEEFRMPHFEPNAPIRRQVLNRLRGGSRTTQHRKSMGSPLNTWVALQ